MQHEKSPASFMWGLIRILDFRSSRKLLTDPRRQNRLVSGEHFFYSNQYFFSMAHMHKILALCLEFTYDKTKGFC